MKKYNISSLTLKYCSNRAENGRNRLFSPIYTLLAFKITQIGPLEAHTLNMGRLPIFKFKYGQAAHI